MAAARSPTIATRGPGRRCMDAPFRSPAWWRLTIHEAAWMVRPGADRGSLLAFSAAASGASAAGGSGGRDEPPWAGPDGLRPPRALLVGGGPKGPYAGR